MKWHDIQEEINNCHECKPALAMITKPVRPPEPQKGDILFMSEAPPPDGGFWEEKTNDALRRNIGSIVTPELANANLMLQKFRDQRLTLVQTLKWPFLETSIAEIRHSALRHTFSKRLHSSTPEKSLRWGKLRVEHYRFSIQNPILQQSSGSLRQSTPFAEENTTPTDSLSE